MRENIKTILVVASVALNLVFAATYATYKLPLFAGDRQPPAPGGHLFLQLDLTPEQLKQFSVERDKFHGQLQELGQEIKARQLELIDLLEATPPDQQAIEKKQGMIQELQRAVQNEVIGHFLQASGFLTDEQRSRFFKLIKSRIQTGLRACPPMMRSVEQCRQGERKNE
jgi:Spy/CpxP family protein refolding chaperone